MHEVHKNKNTNEQQRVWKEKKDKIRKDTFKRNYSNDILIKLEEIRF